jgi:flagellar protein FlgJ
MRRPEFTLPTAATAATASNMAATRPHPAGHVRRWRRALLFHFPGGAGRSRGFISNGSGTAVAAPAAGLTADGAALRARLNSQAAIGGTEPAADGVEPSLQQQFLASIRPYAEEAGQKLGVAPELVAAHAALESGWGQQPLRNGGASSNNLFGIKAGSNWQGAVAAASTTEYEHGAMVRKTERFRSYPDTASAFSDYANLLTGNPRYQAALNTGSDARAFASGLAQGGYATDPHYADKLSKLAAQLQRGGGMASVTPSVD